MERVLAALTRWLQGHPYTLTGLLFLAMVLVGWRELGWGERQLGFLLLIYFIVALGIRLDDITRSLGGHGSSPRPPGGERDTVLACLEDIRALLQRIDAKLDRPGSGDDRPPQP
ncbi:MAG: hypothetical protein MUC46_02215 [Desulfobacterales bacterium]|nr:hypothetical protein [Desulfobacterales bacterium]